jgi:pimeloyl-ACP methyl ester carboxylesterase
MKYIENFHHQVTGNPSGQKLVFLHGLMGSAANWRRIAQAFEAEFNILTFDQRGHGRSFQPATGYRPYDYAQDLAKILDDLGWDKIHLVGHSMGGRNALEFATHSAQRVKKLVIEDIGPDSSSYAINRIEQLLDLVPVPFANRTEAKDFFENQYPQKISFYPQPETVSRFFLSNIEQKPDGTQNWRFSKSAILESLREGRNGDRWDEFQNLRMPVMVMRGEFSKDLPKDVYEKMLRVLPQAIGVEIKGAGHWVHFEQPEAFILTLKNFLTTPT